ncbi:MAG: DUF3598 family protein [Snowella sp.]|nr:DUF3598 family protein [Snowella sp.]
MMENNWENFLKNIGEWRGSFTQVSVDGEILGSTPSILNLEGLEDNQLVRFRLRRFGQGDYNTEPTQDYVQDYRSVGNQIIFFETGTFSKGAFQFAPFSEFGVESGFIAGDRRLRLVQLYDKEAKFSSLTLIREFRQGTDAQERPELTVDQLLGIWEGTATTVYADWTPSETLSTRLEINAIAEDRLQQTLSFGTQSFSSKARIEGKKLVFEEGLTPRQVLLLPDGGSSNAPSKLELRQPFFIEVGWLVTENERQRLIRSYNEKGQWVNSTLVKEYRV